MTMARRAGPSVRSRRLAAELRKLRERGGLTGDGLAKVIGMSPSKISRMEDTTSPLFENDLERLLDFHRVSRQKRMELLDLYRHALDRNWLRVNNHNLPKDWQVWADFEDEASGLFSYQPAVIPGLLQTPEYARAIIAATGKGLTDADVDAMVGSRMAKQSLLSRKTPVRLHAIIEEHVLERPFGTLSDRERQVRHLIDANNRANVSVQILPTEAGLHAGQNGPFVIMQYEQDASLVLLENKVSSMFLDEDEHIDTYEAAWGELRALAYDATESAEMLRSMADKLGG
jgi:transcriptional regulator with XRE-family HTH domain